MEMHPATLWEALADAHPDRPALVRGDVRRTWAEFEDRAARLAIVLLASGVERGATVGLMLSNGPEYLESYFAALKIRAVPFNVNVRYTADEVAYLLADSDAAALVYHAGLGPTVAAAVDRASHRPSLIEVDDGAPPLPGCVERYETAIAVAEPASRIARSGDDVTLVYTGGTTGMPKGVVTRVAPPLAHLLRTVPALLGAAPLTAPEQVIPLTRRHERIVSIPASPLAHGTGLNIGAMPALTFGGTVVALRGRSFDPGEVWDTVERERVSTVAIVGDAFARPMLAALRDGPDRDLSSLRLISSSGATFSAPVKEALLERLPGAMILDVVAATEGTMGTALALPGQPVVTGRFSPAPGVMLVTEDGRPVEPVPGATGLIALPSTAEGYHNDEARTAATFTRIGGRPYTVPGDLARYEEDGELTLLGRGSSCINTAGEKVHPEEVEEVLKTHPAVEDALVFGVADERFGHQVVAVLAHPPGTRATVEAIIAHARTRLAGYKLPRHVQVVERVPRTLVGKPDYPAARALLTAATGTPAREP
ncbi:MAG TPA: AMP-binding protein [Thermomonospora sp.]|nr:AMP-binding protein [Thermomonospora sp.]